ncbi:hypothetical protein [Devosia sp. RR2S18]|uniref:hypothetical protein n=1 Tax=Devosia rhizosphaerae TaxID=3049774 RepID=UPI0025418678|nr:hypothetical protein [Devosia sp. RR2S18]WIJ24990.1 hypothetical protein QOV41_18575 [Devosia sp. RR2S18]
MTKWRQRRRRTKLDELADVAKPLLLSDDPVLRDHGLKLSKVVFSGGEISLDEAFGFRSQGGISARRDEQLAERDVMLRRLVRLVPGWDQLTASALAARMEESFCRYESSRWSRERSKDLGPSDEPALTWWRILKDEARLPQSRRLRDILKLAIQ